MNIDYSYLLEPATLPVTPSQECELFINEVLTACSTPGRRGGFTLAMSTQHTNYSYLEERTSIEQRPPEDQVAGKPH